MRWLGISFACLVASVIGGIAWFNNYMSEGVLETETLTGDVLIALSDDPPVRQALLSGCRSAGSPPGSVSDLLAAGRLAEIPSGTKMHMESWGSDRAIGTMTVAEGHLKGRQVWACRGQFALLHPWP